eukprot:TRINITY_DN1890_c0_g1_i1.p2 TRINITY_DN1890_c0_g1~~TRINITY_DN1890_c0_g1_i1.p2  ORF type:complete len:253 (-),score=28.96 TRINITY_DN1890_c0_g1_i1:647-1405(-)
MPAPPCSSSVAPQADDVGAALKAVAARHLEHLVRAQRARGAAHCERDVAAVRQRQPPPARRAVQQRPRAVTAAAARVGHAQIHARAAGAARGGGGRCARRARAEGADMRACGRVEHVRVARALVERRLNRVARAGKRVRRLLLRGTRGSALCRGCLRCLHTIAARSAQQTFVNTKNVFTSQCAVRNTAQRRTAMACSTGLSCLGASRRQRRKTKADVAAEKMVRCDHTSHAPGGPAAAYLRCPLDTIPPGPA